MIKVRVVVDGGIGINAQPRDQRMDAAARVLQRVEVDLGPGQGADAAGQAEGTASFQQIGDDVAEGVDVLGGHAALAQPGCAQPDAARAQRRSIARDGLAVDDDAGEIQDARRHVAAENCAVRSGHGFAIEQEKVRIGAAIRQAEAARA